MLKIGEKSKEALAALEERSLLEKAEHLLMTATDIDDYERVREEILNMGFNFDDLINDIYSRSI